MSKMLSKAEFQNKWKPGSILYDPVDDCIVEVSGELGKFRLAWDGRRYVAYQVTRNVAEAERVLVKLGDV